MPDPDGVLAVGGSAGSVEALLELVARLPPDLPAPVLVTVHVGGTSRSNLPAILARSGPLPATHARHGEPLLPGRIYVAPPDLHLLTGTGVVRLSSGPRVNRYRPAIDMMFAGAARWAGPRMVAVVLSGVLDDGAVGAALVARAGGRVVVQDPAEALFDSMPRAAWSAVPAAVAAPSTQLAKVISEEFAALQDARAGRVDDEGSRPQMDEPSMADGDDPGYLRQDEVRLTRMSCPECSGGLAEVDLGGIRYYRCHVGHQYGPQTLEAAQRESVESKLWEAAAALEEHAALARHLAGRPAASVASGVLDGYRRAADRSADTARALRSRLHRRAPAAPPSDEAGNPPADATG